MKILNVLKSIILGILGVAFFAFALAMTILLLNYNKYGITQFGDTSLIIIKDNISSEAYKKGDLVLVKSKKIKDIQKADQIFAYSIDSKGNATVELGKVGDVYLEENAISYENGQTYSEEFIIGASSKIYEKIGTYLSVIESKWGFLFLVLVPGFLIFIYEVYALVVEIKYGEE